MKGIEIQIVLPIRHIPYFDTFQKLIFQAADY
jgi:hypothetical protein